MLSSKILNFRRSTKRIIILLVDLLLLPLALWASFSLRLEELYVTTGEVVYLFLVVPVIAVPIFVRFGLSKRYMTNMGLIPIMADQGIKI